MSRRIAYLSTFLVLAACQQGATVADAQTETTVSHAPELLLGEFPYDPVALIRDGEQREGEATHSVEHAYFRYRFVNEANRDAFLADPARFEIQLGGGCGRMGALSDTGDPSRFSVYKDKIYIFASDGCREGFLADPNAVLEPVWDPLPRIHIYAAGLGEQVFQSALDWMGGGEVVDRSEVEWRFETEAEYQGLTYPVLQLQEIGPGQRYRMENRWGDQLRVKEMEGDQAHLLEPDQSLRKAHFSQLRALDRQAQQHLLAIFSARDCENLALSAVPSGEDGVVELMVLVHMIQHKLGVREQTGEILWHEYGGFGAGLVYGTVREEFTRWKQQNGLWVPVAWRRLFNGELVTEVDRPGEGWTLAVNLERAAPATTE